MVKRYFMMLCWLPLLVACGPKVGSDAWCKSMEEKPRGDWTMNETGDFAKYCILRMRPEGE